MSILSTTKAGRFDEWNTFKRENAHPKSKYELQETINQAIKFKGNKVDLNWIDTSAIIIMDYLFWGFYKFNGDISKWDVSNVKDMSGMFKGSEFNGDISKWNVSKVESMICMFEKSKFNGDISKWNVNNVKYMYDMFKNSPLEKNPPEWYKK